MLEVHKNSPWLSVLSSQFSVLSSQFLGWRNGDYGTVDGFACVSSVGCYNPHDAVGAEPVCALTALDR
jgi:hypothetical protein